MGDFNAPSFLKSNNDSKSNVIVNFLSYTHLFQCNNVINCNNHLLDLVITNNKFWAINEADHGLVSIDPNHPPITVNL